MLQAFARIIRAGLRNLVSVELVDVSTYPGIFSLMADLHFSRLETCSLPFSSDIIPFLELHPKLFRLSVDPIPDISIQLDKLLPSIHLPALESFSGPQIAALSIIPNSRARHVGIFWDPRLARTFSDFFETVARSGAEPLELQNTLVTWEPTLVTAIADNFPNLTALSVRNVSSLPMAAEFEVMLTKFFHWCT